MERHFCIARKRPSNASTRFQQPFVHLAHGPILFLPQITSQDLRQANLFAALMRIPYRLKYLGVHRLVSLGRIAAKLIQPLLYLKPKIPPIHSRLQNMRF